MNPLFFKARDGQTPLPAELFRGLRLKHIQTMSELDEAEEANIASGLAWLSAQSSPGLAYEFWLKLHVRLFGKVWSWAGKVRTHALDNTDFYRPGEIWGGLRQLEGDLRFWLDDASMARLEIFARLHERLLTLHPFANGNGRWSRVLTEFVAKQQGQCRVSWATSLSADPQKRRKAYIDAILRARKDGDFEPLMGIMSS